MKHVMAMPLAMFLEISIWAVWDTEASPLYLSRIKKDLTKTFSFPDGHSIQSSGESSGTGRSPAIVYGSDEWEKRDGSGAFNRVGELALMFRTGPGYTAWDNLSALGDKKLKRPYILVIDSQLAVRTKTANFTPVVNPLLGIRTS